MKYSDLLDILQQRAENLGFVAPGTDVADTASLEIYLYQALLDVVEMQDIPAYTFYDTTIATLTAGKPDYPLPETFGRLILPRVQNKRGIFVFDGAGNNSLEYVDPSNFVSHTLAMPNVPTQFTIMARSIWLTPTPGASTLTLRGTYIMRIIRPDADDDVLLTYPVALVEQALFRLATDKGKNPQVLDASRKEAFVRLVAGSR